MFIESASVKKDSLVEADICIIGSGAAGISFALEYANSPRKIVMIESGTLEAQALPDAQYDMESTGLKVSPASRRRAFGGTMTIWSGRWKGFDPIDFSPRAWVPESRWPIRYEDLLPYYSRAAKLFRIPESAEDAENPFKESRFFEATRFAWQPEEKREWGRDHGSFFESSENISIYLGSHLAEFKKNSNAVEYADIRTAGGGSFRVKARIYILACGGIENARLLLLSDIGNEHDQVGRYYMDHPKGKFGIIESYAPFDFSLYSDSANKITNTSMGLRLSDKVQEEHGLLNHYVLFEPAYEGSISKKILGKAFGKGKTDVASVRNYMEQLPAESNRVMLGEEKDAFGYPKARIHWEISEMEKESLKAFHKLLKSELQRLMIGELDSPLLQAPDKFPDMTDASHHMGTTRMGSDAERSVVDKNCKVHSMQNLFIAGSSVFPTSGYANPTATICALSIRLADTIKKLL